MSQPGAPRLWLVRHARPDVLPGVCYGRLDVPALAPANHAAAAALARALPRRLAAACHSPLQRCEQLAVDLRRLRPDLTCEPEARIRELDFGAWEGRAWAELPRAQLDAWAARLHAYAPGGGEPLSAMLARVAAALADATRQAHAGGGDVLWISHAGVARCVHWLLVRGSRTLLTARDWPVAAPGYGQWVCHELAPPPQQGGAPATA